MTQPRQPAITIRDSANLDAFSRLRVSNPLTIFDSTLAEGEDMARWETTLTAGGAFAHNTNRASGILTTASSGDAVVREQHGYSHYIPGKSWLILVTGVFGSAVAGLVRRMGYYSDSDGYYLEQDGTTAVNLVERTSTSGSPVDTPTPQASWNLDPLDGTGPSGLTLDLTKSQILVIDAQWLGVGRVRVGFDVDGLIVYVHEFLHANIVDVVYARTMDLPCRYEINQGSTGGGTLEQICCSVQSEGGSDRFGVISSATTGIVSKALGTGIRQSVFSVRQRATLPVSGSTNRRIAVPMNLTIFVDQDCLVEIVEQYIVDGAPTYGGAPSWTSFSPKSGLEWTSGVTTVTGGHTLATQYIVHTTQGGVTNFNPSVFEQQFVPMRMVSLARNRANTDSDYLHMMVTPIGGSAAIYAGMTFREVS